ncbi:MAG: sigma 54-interacting transcriptional regulator [Deltaproteobacteria bacterium]|nr:sigma 54-interacting transcriptional regulator [Deltaproteobacteria bacterium]
MLPGKHGVTEIFFKPIPHDVKFTTIRIDRQPNKSVSANRGLTNLSGANLPPDVTVLVSGETGVGKELVVRAIHAGSNRKDGPIAIQPKRLRAIQEGKTQRVGSEKRI